MGAFNREALGVTLEDLGHVCVLINRECIVLSVEANGDIKLSTLKKMAEGLGMTFVYGFVSKDSLEQKMKEQARTIAVKRLGRIDHSMKLEKQGLLKKIRNLHLMI